VASTIEVLREGRCAHSSAFKAYTYFVIWGQVESFLQVVNAYLYITFADWCWIFMDGVWAASMAFSLPLACAAKKLSAIRPTASLFGARTLSSVLGLLSINIFFICMALYALNQQDWYLCRKWTSEDVSSVITIGDNYESSVLFIVGPYQYIASAVAMNFGYKFRAAWYTNYVFLGLVVLHAGFFVTMTLHPSPFSCIWRVNCSNNVSFHKWIFKNSILWFLDLTSRSRFLIF
jgi:magnesium-transporting ATPase (P-type)